MPNISHKTVPVAFRLDIKAYTIINKRAEKRGLTVGHYLKGLVEYDALRKR